MAVVIHCTVKGVLKIPLFGRGYRLAECYVITTVAHRGEGRKAVQDRATDSVKKKWPCDYVIENFAFFMRSAARDGSQVWTVINRQWRVRVKKDKILGGIFYLYQNKWINLSL